MLTKAGMGNEDIGVIVARFQVAELHDGHERLIKTVMMSHRNVIIFLGTTPTLGTKDNPLSYAARYQMVNSWIISNKNKSFKSISEAAIATTNVIISPIADNPSNDVWSANLDNAIRDIFPMGSVCLYGGKNDSFLNVYSGQFPAIEVLKSTHSGINTRTILKTKTINSYDFRAGVIHASQNTYPKCYPTVDIAVTGYSLKPGVYSVLMGRKIGGEKFCFPGGFVDPNDASYEVAARRELEEEITGLIYPRPDQFQYVCSTIIDDWRYRYEHEKIKTILFQADFIDGSPAIGEEFEELAWIDIEESSMDAISNSHKRLFRTLINFMEERKVKV